MNTIRINDIKYPVPSEWSEVPIEKRIGLWLIVNDRAGEIIGGIEDIYIIQYRALLYITGIEHKVLERWRSDIGEEDFTDGLNALVDLMGWLFSPTKEGKYMLSPILAAPMKEIQVIEDGQKMPYQCISDHMKEISFGQLLKLFTCVEAIDIDAFHSPETKKIINTLLSVCFPGIPDALCYQVHDVIRQYVVYWAMSIRQMYVENYENLFEAAKIEGERVGNDYSWGGLVMALAPDVTKLQEVQNQNGEDVFVYLSYLEDERKRNELLMKKK